MGEPNIRPPQRTAEESWCGYAIKSALYKAYPILARKNCVFKYYECESGEDDVAKCKVAKMAVNRTGVGTFRSTVGGEGHQNTPDKKPRAADIYLDSKKPEELQIGNAILRKLLANAAVLRVKYVTWINVVNFPNGTTKPLSAKYQSNSTDRHENHLHVEFTDAYNVNTGIVAAFARVFPPAADSK